MRALEYCGAWEMRVVDRPDPDQTGESVVLDIVATGICGSDVHGYTGETGRRVAGQVMGHESVARVRSGGELEPGTVVTFNPVIACGACEACLAGQSQVCPDARLIGVDPSIGGSFAERIAVPARNVVPLNNDMPVFHGTLVEPLAVGYHAVMRGEPTADDRVLIIGGGPIGQAAAIGARRAGMTRILVSEPSESRRRLLEQLGFEATTPDTLAAIVEPTLGGKATLVIDAVGIGPSLAAAIASSTTRARIVLVGMGTNRMEVEPYGLTVAERTLLGSYCYTDAHLRETAAWVAEGHPELDLLIDRVLSLAEGPEAFRALADGQAGSNKTLISPLLIGEIQ